MQKIRNIPKNLKILFDFKILIKIMKKLLMLFAICATMMACTGNVTKPEAEAVDSDSIADTTVVDTTLIDTINVDFD